jgi:hypothetical protein
MASNSFHRRLDLIEDKLRSIDGDAPAQWTELRNLFTAEPTNAALLGTAGAMAGTRSLPRLLALQSDDHRLSSLIGELRHALGKFCQRQRIVCPESKLIKVRYIPGAGDRNLITLAGPESGSRFLQLFEFNSPEIEVVQ